MSHTRQTLHGSPEKSTACPFPEILDIGDPRPKKAEKDHLFGPCGAKLWGSGGAPPTNLILLRNQRPPPEGLATRARRRRHGTLERERSVERRSTTTHNSLGPRATHPNADSHSGGVVVGEWHLSVSGRTASNAGPVYLRLRKLRLRRCALPRIHSRKSPWFPLSRPRCSVIRSGAFAIAHRLLRLDHL